MKEWRVVVAGVLGDTAPEFLFFEDVPIALGSVAASPRSDNIDKLFSLGHARSGPACH